MGFFDFLVLRGKTDGQDGPVPEPLFTSSTRTLQALLEVPKPERRNAWQQRFLAHVGDAAFHAGDPTIILGSDQFPYFVLRSSAAMPGYPAHVIHHMKDDFLLEQGLGVVINPDGQDADWAFTYGDIINYHLNGVFYPPQSHLAPAGAGEPELEADPDTELPAGIRKALRAFLQKMGVAKPGVCIAARGRKGKGSLELIFNFSPKEFRSLDDFKFVMDGIYWYLPRHYAYSVAGNEARSSAAFQPL